MFTVLVLDSSGTEVGRYEALDESTGLISIGGGPEDHIFIQALPAAQVYLYVSNGELVIEDPNGTGQVTMDGYLLDQPAYASVDSDIVAAGFWIRLVRSDPAQAGTPAPPDPAQSLPIPPPPADADETPGYYQAGAAQVASDLAYAPGGPATITGGIYLEGVAGQMSGHKFPLQPGQIHDLGRDEILEIFVNDPTVSRRHARLTVNDGGITILDLRSTNGVFVNGEKIKRQVVLPGDRVRFGEVAFRVKQENDPVAQARPHSGLSTRQSALVAAAAVGLAVVLVVGLGIKRRLEKRSGRKTTTTSVTAADKRRMKFNRLLEATRSALDHEQWARALDLTQQALELADGPDEKAKAQDLAGKARREMEAKKTLAEADRIFETAGSNLELLHRAAQLYKKIPVASYYGTHALRQLDKVAFQVARQYEATALGLINARSVKRRVQAHKLLCEYFKTIGSIHSAVPGEGLNRERLKKLEKLLKKRLRNNKTSEFAPCQARRFLHAGLVASTGPDPVTLLSAKYPPKIADALLSYQQGHMDRALIRLMKLRDKRSMKAHKQLLSDLQERLGLIKGKLATVDAAIQKNDAVGADRALRSALDVEKQVLPKPLRGFEVREASHRVADLYYRLGETQFRSKRYQSAFQYWKRGLFFETSHPKLLDGLARLEKAAVGILRQAAAYQGSEPRKAKMYYEQVRDMTTLESPLHLQAIAALKKLK